DHFLDRHLVHVPRLFFTIPRDKRHGAPLGDQAQNDRGRTVRNIGMNALKPGFEIHTNRILQSKYKKLSKSNVILFTNRWDKESAQHSATFEWSKQQQYSKDRQSLHVVSSRFSPPRFLNRLPTSTWQRLITDGGFYGSTYGKCSVGR